MKKILKYIVLLMGIVALQAQEKTMEVVNVSDPEEEVPFAVVETVPQFEACKGVEPALQRNCFVELVNQHIRKHFSYPKEARKQKISGRVIVTFIIDSEGKITHISSRGEPILCQEAERIIKLLPPLQPGKNRRKNVAVTYAVPITFMLD
jgi:protein TonB